MTEPGVIPLEIRYLESIINYYHAFGYLIIANPEFLVYKLLRIR